MWTNSSDRDSKENFEPVNSREVLNQVLKLPVQTWNYKVEDPSVRHIGMMAQDFSAAFNVGQDDKHIGTIDADGVAIAAIKGLAVIVEEKENRINELENRLKKLESILKRD
jgi:hypothetical protein